MFDSEIDRDEFLRWYGERRAEGFAFSPWDRERYAEALKQTLVGEWVEVQLPEYQGITGQVVQILDHMPLEPLVAVRLREPGAGHPPRTVDVVATRLKPGEPPHGTSRNHGTITTVGKSVEFVDAAGKTVYSGPGSMSQRGSCERYCRACRAWQNCGGEGAGSWIMAQMICPTCKTNWVD